MRGVVHRLFLLGIRHFVLSKSQFFGRVEKNKNYR